MGKMASLVNMTTLTPRRSPRLASKRPSNISTPVRNKLRKCMMAKQTFQQTAYHKITVLKNFARLDIFFGGNIGKKASDCTRARTCVMSLECDRKWARVSGFKNSISTSWGWLAKKLLQHGRFILLLYFNALLHYGLLHPSISFFFHQKLYMYHYYYNVNLLLKWHFLGCWLDLQWMKPHQKGQYALKIVKAYLERHFQSILYCWDLKHKWIVHFNQWQYTHTQHILWDIHVHV